MLHCLYHYVWFKWKVRETTMGHWCISCHPKQFFCIKKINPPDWTRNKIIFHGCPLGMGCSLTYLDWIWQHRDGWHEAGGQGQGDGQGRQSAASHQEVPRASLAPVRPGKVDPDRGRHQQHESKDHIVRSHKWACYQRVPWHFGRSQTKAQIRKPNSSESYSHCPMCAALRHRNRQSSVDKWRCWHITSSLNAEPKAGQQTETF